MKINLKALCPSFLIACLISGCAVIAGNEGSHVTPPFTLPFVETLISQKSLSGESYRNLPEESSPASALLQKPTGVFADRFRVYVADRYFNPPASARVVVFDRGARTASDLAITPPPGSSVNEGALLAPAGIAVASTGIIYVSDSQQGKVFGYDLNGRLAMTLGSPQAIQAVTGRGDLSSPYALAPDGIQAPMGLGELAKPSGLAVDSARSRLYVTDMALHKIKVYDEKLGTYLFDYDTLGSAAKGLRFPESIALDRAGNLYVVDSHRLKVFILHPEKKAARVFSLKGDIPGRSIKPMGIAVDSFGHIYVADSVNNNVLIFNNDGTFLHSWGRTGRVIGDFWTPMGIFIDELDYVYVVDQSNNRIQVFRYLP